ncbi:DNA translocase FtsK [Levilactobacillus sp. HBUAS70063]|uniref:DNA translocase FtsK n=1 Tax=Levilactobacillus sp. HBUAS70063 TaxID=3109359 RepID=UPI003132CD5E
MEHYDGPAFFRKFAVKPSPEQLEDTTAERAQRSVKQRRERNDRLRLREERENQRRQAAQQSPRQSEEPARSAAVTSAQSAAASVTPHSSAENYRPFQVTPIPKQLHWSRPTSASRRRYRRLIKRLEKADSSFLLFGAAAETEMVSDAPVAASQAEQSSAATPVAEKVTDEVENMPSTAPETMSTAATATSRAALTADASAESVTRPTQSDSAANLSAIADTETTAETVAADSSEPSAAVAAPTEIFYPQSQTATSATPASTASNTATSTASSVVSGAGDYLPVGMQAPTSAVASSAESAAAQTSDTATRESSVVSTATTAQSTADSAATGVVSSAAMIRSTAHLAVSSAAGTPASVASTNHQPAVTADATTRRVSTSVADLTATSASMPASSVAVTASTASSAAAESTAARPSEVNQLLDRTQATDRPAAQTTTSSETKTPAKPKPKPTRGLGHSLGDIMQEEGNDQRNLALFDRPDTPAVSAEDATAADRGYHFPDVSLLPKPVVPDEEALDEWIEHQAEVLDATLSAFHVDAHVTDWTVGPTVTQFQISLALGVKVNKITNLNDDLKLALAAKDIRIEAPIPGKTTVGIEIPNVKSRPVMLSEILNSPAFKKSESPLTVALGVDLFGKPQVTDLRKMPHGLIAGATGSGKSVFINSLLLSILYKATPAQVKLLLIDPKAVEMAPYDGLPHLLSPVISDPKAAAAALKWVVTEMDQRYEKLAAAGVRNIEQFNDRADANDEPSLKMPYIVIIIDELADLMMMAASEVQDYIVRITQKARAAGIHLLVATQRPSVDIVTGTIKNNIPTRIAFMVSSQIDSRTILDTAGAESLLGRGDMLYLGNGASQPMRLQGAFVESEVDAITDFVRTQGKPHYAFEPQGLLQRETAEENQDELLPKVLAYIAEEKTVSTSKLQRVFSIGYNRAANLIDDLEQHHYVSPQHGSKPREVYLTPDDLGKDLPEPHDKDAPSSL